jgi:hypothetical protein
VKLFLVHCGHYDVEVGDGIFEFHTNFLVAAEDFQGARARAKELPPFKSKRMHVDGIQEIEAVDGFRVELIPDSALHGESIVKSHRHRDLAPPKPAAPI